MSDTDSFMYRTSLNCDGIVGMCFENGERTETNEVQFALAIVSRDPNLIAGLKVMMCPAPVGPEKTKVNESLAMVRESKNVSYKRNIQEHSV